MSEIAIKIENLRKQYKLGAIGGQTLNAELQSWWARKRGKEDPNLLIGENYVNAGEVFWALDGINLEIKKGETLGIIGGNGAGKSTLLKILSRVTAPTEGDVWIDGRISSMLEVGTGFHGELTGRENIYMNGAILGMTRKEVDEKIESIIDFSECRQFIDTPVKRYSSGMYVKLAFAVASNLDSEIMVMDEVLAVGDMKFQKKCLGKMGDASQREGKTVLYVSHNMETIRTLCSRCIVLKKGKIVFDGDVEPAIAKYMDDSENALQKVYDFSNTPMTDPAFYRQEVQLLKLFFYDRDIPIFSCEEYMCFSIVLLGINDISTVRVRIEVRALDDTFVGMTESKQIGLIRKDEIKNIKLRFRLNNLAGGTYKFRLSLFKLDSVGVHRGLDDTPSKICFEVVDDVPDRTIWNKHYWGNVRLNDVELVD